MAPAGSEDAVPEMIKETESPARWVELRDTVLAIAKPEKMQAEEFESLVTSAHGFRFFENQMSSLTKPAFEWIQNNLFAGIEKPLVGVFTLKEEEETLGYLIIKRESESAPVVYLVSQDGELKHLTRRL